MPDNKTLLDQVHDFRLEIKLLRDELKKNQDVLHTLHGTAASLAGTVEDYKAANTELRYQLELAREEANQAYKRADQYRAQLSALGDRFSAMCAMNAELQRKLDEVTNG